MERPATQYIFYIPLFHILTRMSAMNWVYAILAIALIVGIWIGFCVVCDIYEYRNLQRRLREELRMKAEEKEIGASA